MDWEETIKSKNCKKLVGTKYPTLNAMKLR